MNTYIFHRSRFFFINNTLNLYNYIHIQIVQRQKNHNNTSKLQLQRYRLIKNRKKPRHQSYVQQDEEAVTLLLLLHSYTNVNKLYNAYSLLNIDYIHQYNLYVMTSYKHLRYSIPILSNKPFRRFRNPLLKYP